ncbi:hypothetical protein [Jeongeupia chitinilytica]|nr:hypothetical protein [Jeongeupia chitinilytica]
MSALAFLLCLTAASLAYLSSPQQRLLAVRSAGRRSRRLAVLLAIAGTGVWMGAADVASGLVAALLVMMLTSVALPYLALLVPERR